MFHIVAGRRLMALRAVDGVCGGMLELRNHLVCCAVTIGAFGAEQAIVRLFSGVAVSAVERQF